MTNGIQSRLHDAITVFARFLRQAGFTIGTGEIMMAIKACSMVETGNREDFRQAIKSSFITDHKTIPLFDQLFDLYWRNPDRLENVSDILRKLYESRLAQAELSSMKDQIKEIYQKRVEGIESNSQEEGESSEAFDVFLYSPEEVLRRKRFDAYTQEEIDEALKFIGDFDWGFVNRKIRRLKTGNRPYKLDIRQTIRNNIFPNQDFIDLKWKDRKHKPRPLVVLTDISGSMEQYTRILLHFIYSLYQVNHHVEAFTFGTRLSRITHYLKQKDVNDALDYINESVKDWSGGTKIGETLEQFNRFWARRVLSGGAVVMVISDGLDTGNIEMLQREIDRLTRSCHWLIWMNPNLGYEDYAPLTQGIQTILPHVDDFLPIHNLDSLITLGKVLNTLQKRTNKRIAA